MRSSCSCKKSSLCCWARVHPSRSWKACPRWVENASMSLHSLRLALLDNEDVGDGEALRRLAMLRPRYVMDDTAASASPDSHSVDRSTPLE